MLEDLRAGRLAVVSTDPALATATDKLGRRLFAAIVVVALAGGGSALEAVDRHPQLGTGMLIAAAAYALLHVVLDRRKR